MRNLLTFLILTTCFLCYPATTNASWVCQSDSLHEINISGYVIVDTTIKHSRFYLDLEDDGIVDYQLNFGPWWYMPDSGKAVRPIDGQVVQVEGLVCLTCEDSLPVIKVSSIDGEFWRDPFSPSWNQVGKKHRYNWSYRNHHGFAFGWLNDSLTWTEVDGVALIDTTFKHYHYFLDINNDTIPDYKLNFGPPWYDNSDEVDRPEAFESIKIGGYLFEKNGFDLLFVIEINDYVWVDTTSWSGQFGGSWIHRNMKQHRKIHVMHDSSSGLKISNGWFVNNEGDKNPPDSVFCQILELFPENMPYINQQRILAAYEIGLFKPNHQNMLSNGDSIGSQIGFTHQIRYTFRYRDQNLEKSKILENDLAVKIWDLETKRWEVIKNAIFEYDKNIIYFDLDVIPGLIIISEEITTAILDVESNKPEGFVLRQNYPNPFNSGTKIEFYLAKNNMVELSIYNVLGEKIKTILNGNMSKGLHMVHLELNDLSSGVYYYLLKTEKNQAMRKMILLK